MYYCFSFLCGTLTAIMVVVNGKLAAAAGKYSASIITHLVGLVLMLLILELRNQRVRPFSHGLPWRRYLGGAIGVATVVGNNLAFGGISVSAIMALCLFGQMVTSLIVDQYGLLGMRKRPFRREKLWSLLFVAIGILCMLYPFSVARPAAVFFAACTGVSIVLSRSVNAQLTNHIGSLPTTFYNYLTGLILSVIVVLLLGRGDPMWHGAALPANPLLYTGSIMGMAAVMLMNHSVQKISAVYLTLLQFIGQVTAGVVLDMLLSGAFAWQNLVGGVCMSIGMVLNIMMEQRDKASPQYESV